MPATSKTLRMGALTGVVEDGALRALCLGGVEVLRGLSYPVRDRDWGTCLVRTTAEETGSTQYRRTFAALDGSFSGVFRLVLSAADRAEAEVEIRFLADTAVNRAGFTLLHPIVGVAGQPLTVRHSDGRSDQTRFPQAISPGQPVFDITGLTHAIGPVRVDITMTGDVFEMEDQRNWSDASFKTYCRPLSLPRPFDVAAGDVIRQRVTLHLTDAAPTAAAMPATATQSATLPQVLLAHEPGLSSAAGMAAFPGVPVLLRLTSATSDADLAALGNRPLALEIVWSDAADLSARIARCQTAGLQPARVMALPGAYLKSHQPEGPWPDPRPAKAIAPLRHAFPTALVGGGSLTHFTEANRCRPEPADIDFLGFGNTAIVHAADDGSVWQTLQALPDIFASASAMAAGRPLHLGLFSIGMRSNPYGAALAPNSDRLRMTMTADDPRQATGFAAAYAVCVLALAAQAGVQSIALAMPDGPLGALGHPVEAVLRRAVTLAGQTAQIAISGGLTVISTEGGGMAANIQGVPRNLPAGTVAAESVLIWGDAA